MDSMMCIPLPDFVVTLHHPIVPCLMYPAIYATFAQYHNVVYIGQTGATSPTVNQLPKITAFERTKEGPPLTYTGKFSISSPNFTTSTRTTRMVVRLSKEYPTLTFTQDTEFFNTSLQPPATT